MPAAAGPASRESLATLNERIIACERCERLRPYCAEVARVRRRAYADFEYWGRPVPSFGDPKARVLLLGLAPGAHGSNRTGRMFTGDGSGDFLFPVLHEAGFASQPKSVARDDGMKLRDLWISAVVHCAPPGNKPCLLYTSGHQRQPARKFVLRAMAKHQTFARTDPPSPQLVRQESIKRDLAQAPVSYTHLDVYKRQVR